MKIKTLIDERSSKSRDPYVLRHKEKVYYCFSRDEKIYLVVAERLEGLKDAEETVVYENEEGLKELWAPELHVIHNKCYIYVAADDGRNENHRMYVLANGADDPLKQYRNLGMVRGMEEKWAIDGTVLRQGEGLYFVWSGCEGKIYERQEIFIAKMASPTAICGEKVRISTPGYDWEKRGGDGVRLPYVNEGPAVLEWGGKTYIVYSASGCWCGDYCLGILELVGESLLERNAWEKSRRPFFQGNEEIIGPGHCSFVKENGEQYMVFHAFNEREDLDLRNVEVKCVEVSEVMDKYEKL